MLEFAPSFGQIQMYQTIDVYTVGTTALYTPPPKPFGLMNEQPFQYGYELPATGTQFHFHGPDRDHLTYGRLKDHNGNILFEEKDSFKLAMNDLYFDKWRFKKFP